MPSIVLGELQAGFRLGTRAGFRMFASSTNSWTTRWWRSCPWTRSLHKSTEKYSPTCGARGRPLPTNDIWIAATAVRAGASVLTFDEHFREIVRVGSLVLEPPVT